MASPQARAIHQTRRWKAVSLYVRQRDRYRCRDCGKAGNTAHHEPSIDTLLRTGRDPYDPRYCVTLCCVCHGKRDGSGDATGSPMVAPAPRNRFLGVIGRTGGS